jgi:hypothetical protein
LEGVLGYAAEGMMGALQKESRSLRDFLKWLVSDDGGEPDIDATTLVGVYRSTSGRYRILARLPDGMTGKQALEWAMLTHRGVTELPKHDQEWIGRIDEREAASHFLRVYTDYPFARHLRLELTIEQFKEFKKAGGQFA